MSLCSPEKRAKISVAMQARWLDIKYRAWQVAAHRGNLLSPETRAKLLASKRKPEYRAKQAAISRALWRSNKYRAKHAAAYRMRSVNQEWKRNIIDANRKMAKDPAWRARISAAIRQKYLDDPTYRARLAAANLGKRQGPVTRAKIAASHRGKVLSTETRARISAAARRPERLAKLSAEQCGKPKSPEARVNMKIAAQRRSQDPHWLSNTTAASRKKAKMPGWLRNNAIARRCSRLVRPTSIELSIRALLDRLEIVYVPEHRIGKYLADIFIPEKNLVVECDGEYWHGRPGIAVSDFLRDTYMIARGYDVVRLPEREIREGRAVERLLRLVGKNNG